MGPVIDHQDTFRIFDLWLIAMLKLTLWSRSWRWSIPGSTLEPKVKFWRLVFCLAQTIELQGSGCRWVGRLVASNTWGPRFESNHRQNLNWTLVYCQLYWKDENKEKEAGNGPFKKTIELLHFWANVFGKTSPSPFWMYFYEVFLKENCQPRPLFVYFCSFQQQYYRKIVDFRGNRTRIVW